MKAPMITFGGVKRVRKYRCYHSLRNSVAADKRRLRRIARRKDRAAVRGGDYETVSRGLSAYDVV